ncbi:MAG: HAD family hydrolase, partial [Halobacteriaceae archaeon]
DALARDHQLGLVTNGTPDLQRARLDATGIADAFDTVVYAGFETAAKPDTEPFETALSALDATPERAVHVGNSLSSDVAGACRAGLRAAWVPATGDDPDPEPDDALASLDALLDPPWR